MDTYKKYRAAMEKLSLEERASQALTLEEEVALQKNIVIGHHERLKNGLPGYDLTSFGTYPKAIPARDFGLHQHIGYHLGTMPLMSPAPIVPSLESEYSKRLGLGRHPTNPFSASEMTKGQRQTDFNRRNKERLSLGLPELNPQDFGL